MSSPTNNQEPPWMGQVWHPTSRRRTLISAIGDQLPPFTANPQTSFPHLGRNQETQLQGQAMFAEPPLLNDPRQWLRNTAGIYGLATIPLPPHHLTPCNDLRGYWYPPNLVPGCDSDTPNPKPQSSNKGQFPSLSERTMTPSMPMASTMSGQPLPLSTNESSVPSAPRHGSYNDGTLKPAPHSEAPATGTTWTSISPRTKEHPSPDNDTLPLWLEFLPTETGSYMPPQLATEYWGSSHERTRNRATWRSPYNRATNLT
ncbi:hypothetical protein ARMSODRAFT_1026680 [Armillaria solidipes]|uniref:Uncharacterized protein n=1 Tax=Armillaria solidipes TaxID=1076256 RepID=A0A2H3ARP0_9AGAR|nr:hypothetical protein ARMSODRAFT_1026680 [Armillaria solidipes]